MSDENPQSEWELNKGKEEAQPNQTSWGDSYRENDESRASQLRALEEKFGASSESMSSQSHKPLDVRKDYQSSTPRPIEKQRRIKQLHELLELSPPSDVKKEIEDMAVQINPANPKKALEEAMGRLINSEAKHADGRHMPESIILREIAENLAGMQWEQRQGLGR